MALTKEFRETTYRRAQRDAAFRKALLTEAVNAYLGGDEATGKAVLRDVINATIGFEQLAAAVHKPSKSLHRMLGPHGNPSTANFFAVLRALQENRRSIQGESSMILLRPFLGFQFVLTSAAHRLNQLTKNFFSSAFVSAGRCSISQCPVSARMTEVTLFETIFA